MASSSIVSWIAGMDLGGTNVRLTIAPIDEESLVRGELPPLIQETRRRLTDRSPQGIAAFVAEQLQEMRGEQAPPIKLYLGAAVAAMLDATGQIVVNAPNLGWRDEPFARLLTEVLGPHCQVTLYNDLKAATYGEFVAGAGREVRDMVCVLVGSGVGSGFVLDRRLHRGATNVAGELGHVKVASSNGLPCGCGARGCLEAYAGGHNLERLAREAVDEGDQGYLAQRAKEIGVEALTCADLEKGAQQKDPTCSRLLQQAASYLGLSLANLVITLNPARLLLGGGVLANSPTYLQWTRQHIEDRLLPVAAKPLDICAPLLEDRAGLVGAAALAFEELRRDSQT
jgi:glucokinase